jgi:acyl-CoA hydrolase
MRQTIALESLRLEGIIEPGDGIVSSNGCGESLCVLEKLVEQRHALGKLRMFLGAGFAPLLKLADLRGKSLRERRKAMIQLAALQFRDELERAMHGLGRAQG